MANDTKQRITQDENEQAENVAADEWPLIDITKEYPRVDFSTDQSELNSTEQWER